MTHPTNHSHDVIIVGAGPAGATLAYELSRKGIDVLILEKERLPRYKACAGGITVKTAKLLDLDFSSVTRDTVRGAKVAYGSRRSFTKSYPQPLIHMVMRDEFDQLLVQRAREAGATLADNERVRQVEIAEQVVKVETANHVFTAQIVVGADGARSIVAANVGLMQDVDLGIGLEAEISVPGQRLVQWESLMGLDLGHMRGGYGWVFPKKDHLSVGVGSPLRQAKRLKSGYQAVLKVTRSQRLFGDQDQKSLAAGAPERNGDPIWEVSAARGCGGTGRPGHRGGHLQRRQERPDSSTGHRTLPAGQQCEPPGVRGCRGQTDHAGTESRQSAGQGVCLVSRTRSSTRWRAATGCGMPAAGCCGAKTHISHSRGDWGRPRSSSIC